MHPFGYNDDYLMRLEDAFKCLPNVKPRKARATLRDWQDIFFNEMTEAISAGKEKDVYEITIGKDIILTSKDFDHLLYDNGYSAVKITPEGAGILITAYQKGLFELQSGKSIEPVSDELLEYSKSRELILNRQESDEIKRAEKHKKYRELLGNPQLVDPKKFTFKLLNDIFIEHFGLKGGSHSMEIGGILVTKSVHMYTSNSGKTRDNDVTFSWKNKNGESKELKKYSIFSPNRRNDPDRNWGLHE